MTPAPRRELHLHVGLPKTGTTHLQKCLGLNRAEIVARGFALAWRARDEGPGAVAVRGAV